MKRSSLLFNYDKYDSGTPEMFNTLSLSACPVVNVVAYYHYNKKLFMFLIVSLSPSATDCIRTLDLSNMSRVFNHCAARGLVLYSQYFIFIVT